jgi:hypothetical protein
VFTGVSKGISIFITLRWRVQISPTLHSQNPCKSGVLAFLGKNEISPNRTFLPGVMYWSNVFDENGVFFEDKPGHKTVKKVSKTSRFTPFLPSLKRGQAKAHFFEVLFIA